MNILVVDDNPEFAEYLATVTEGLGHATRVAHSASAAMALAASAQPQVAFLDLDLPDQHGLALLPRLLACRPNLRVVIVTGGPSLESAVRAIKLGADNYLKKPLDLSELRTVLEHLAGQLQPTPILDRVRAAAGRSLPGHLLIGDPAMVRVYERVMQVCDKERIGVMVFGETGSGKEHVAQLLHLLSARSAKPFVELNCAALPESLLEAELFGYEQGAFTDARRCKPGLFEVANGGTLFLDEVAEMSMVMQAKLLKVIEQKQVRRLGGVQSVPLDVRLVAATNRDLAGEVKAGRFRPDLYYRLNVFPIVVPPLRGRRQAIRELALHFYAVACREYLLEPRPLREEVLLRLEDLSWPGNVRELRAHIERMVIEGDPCMLQAPGPDAPEAEPFDPEQSAERDRLSTLLHEHHWNKSQVAKSLGISRPTLLSKLKKCGLVE